jgi:hypothetical protein
MDAGKGAAAKRKKRMYALTGDDWEVLEKFRDSLEVFRPSAATAPKLYLI